MWLTASKPDSKYTVIALQEIILLRVRHLAISEEKETIPVASVRLVIHRKSGKRMMDFMHHFPYVYLFCPVILTNFLF